MTKRLQDKTAIITGGANGMGRETALLFLEEGALVLIADINQENAEVTLDIARERGFGNRIIFQPTDVTEETQIVAMFDEAFDQFGRVNIVFNNAGIGGAVGDITEITVDEWDYTFHALVRSVFLGTKYAARVMKRQYQGGAIINTASIAGLAGGAGPHAYSAAKAAVINLTRSVAMELAQYKIRVNAIAPGLIVTDLARNLPACSRTRECTTITCCWTRATHC